LFGAFGWYLYSIDFVPWLYRSTYTLFFHSSSSTSAPSITKERAEETTSLLPSEAEKKKKKDKDGKVEYPRYKKVHMHAHFTHFLPTTARILTNMN